MVTKRARLWLSRGLAITVFVVAAGLFAATWYYSGEIEREVFASRTLDTTPDVVLLHVAAAQVSIPTDSRTTKPGQWGLDFSEGYAKVGPVLAEAAGVVSRQLITIDGLVAAGQRAAWDRMAFPDPESRGIAYGEALIDGPLGPLPAWLTPGESDTWVVFVHGAGADRREALRAIPTAQALGLPTLTITYRNDAGAPPSSSGRHGYGRNEWADLEAAVEFAVGEGATHVVLVGYGTGGSIVSVFMRNSRLTEMVSGLVFDSPVLDAGQLVDGLAAGDKVPGFIVDWSRAMASFRFGVEWSALDHIDAASEIAVPVLLFHGTDDAEAPITSSREYIAALGELATMITVPGADHGESWNLDPEAYQSALSEFLQAAATAPPEDDE
ncbi:MAG: alpha/beta hydrolase [Actinomycetota bacterium]|nr:alpha/beta hydrolase [Actinomycetota bacterium]